MENGKFESAFRGCLWQYLENIERRFRK